MTDDERDARIAALEADLDLIARICIRAAGDGAGARSRAIVQWIPAVVDHARDGIPTATYQQARETFGP